MGGVRPVRSVAQVSWALPNAAGQALVGELLLRAGLVRTKCSGVVEVSPEAPTEFSVILTVRSWSISCR